MIDYAKLIADEYAAIGAVDAKVCYNYAAIGGDSGRALDLLSSELKQRELRLSEQLLSSTAPSRNAPSKQELEALYGKVFKKLVARYGDADVRLLSEPAKVKPTEYAAYCRGVAAMFREFAQLPPLEAGSVLSAVFKESASDAK